MKTKKPIFEEKTKLGKLGRHSSDWIVINNRKYLSVKTAENTIKMFKVQKENDSYSFKEDTKYSITLEETDNIMFSAFDRNFKHIMTLRNGNILERRAVNNKNNVIKSITLEEKVGGSTLRQLCLSNDGNFCMIAGGLCKAYSYFVDIENNKQTKLESGKLTGTFAPCFVNGEPKFAAVGSEEGIVEIWDVHKQELVKSIHNESKDSISCTTSVNNIMAVCSVDQTLRLYDVRNWEMFYSQTFDMTPRSLHLTDDSKYVTIGGGGGEKCVVLQIQ